MVGHSCWCLHSSWLSLQQKLDGSWWWSCSVVEPLMLISEVQICRSSWISSHGCEVFREIVDALHIWQCLVPGLNISSQATEYLVLGDCKGASPGRNKVSPLIEPLVSTKGKIFVNVLLCLQLERFEDYLLNICSILCFLSFRSNWGTTSIT
jgi:hypothetical protein